MSYELKILAICVSLIAFVDAAMFYIQLRKDKKRRKE
jgi:hypothetical protein